MTFEARFHSNCANCDGKINPGDLAAYNAEDEVVHVVCPNGAALELAPGESVCEACWLVHPDGACDA